MVSNTFPKLFLGLKCPFRPGPPFCVGFKQIYPETVRLPGKPLQTYSCRVNDALVLLVDSVHTCRSCLYPLQCYSTSLVKTPPWHYEHLENTDCPLFLFISHGTQQELNKYLMNKWFCTPLLTSHVMLGKLYSLLVPQFPHLWFII